MYPHSHPRHASNIRYYIAFQDHSHAWYAPYSGYFGTENGNDADADRFNKIIEEGEANGMPLGFIYSSSHNKTSKLVIASYTSLEVYKKTMGLSPHLYYNLMLKYLPILL